MTTQFGTMSNASYVVHRISIEYYGRFDRFKGSKNYVRVVKLQHGYERPGTVSSDVLCIPGSIMKLLGIDKHAALGTWKHKYCKYLDLREDT